MKTVVIFGGSGFIGQNIIRRLAKEGCRIIVPYQRPTNEAKLRLYGNVGQIIPVNFSSLFEDRIIDLINSADFIVNLKTIWQEKKKYSYKVNILEFNLQLVELIKSANKNKVFVFFSGLGVSKQSSSNRVKYIAKVENYIKENLINYLIIRPSIVIGEGDQFIRKLLLIFKFSYFVPLFGRKKVKIQPVFVDDIACVVEHFFKKNLRNSGIFELGGPEIFSYKSFYQYIISCLGLKRHFVTIPFKLAMFITSIMEKIKINLITKDQLYLFREDNICSNENKKFSDLGIVPQDLKIVIKRLLKNIS